MNRFLREKFSLVKINFFLDRNKVKLGGRLPLMISYGFMDNVEHFFFWPCSILHLSAFLPNRTTHLSLPRPCLVHRLFHTHIHSHTHTHRSRLETCFLQSCAPRSTWLRRRSRLNLRYVFDACFLSRCLNFFKREGIRVTNSGRFYKLVFSVSRNFFFSFQEKNSSPFNSC